jgi:TolB-like protein
LQALAEPGGVAVSEAVRGAVGGRLGISFQDLGAQSVKNIAEPVRAYGVRAAANAALASDGTLAARDLRVVGRGRRSAVGVSIALVALAAWLLAARPWNALRPADPAPPPLSVAVMPFVAAAAGAEDVAWADGLTQSTTTGLSQWRWATVAAPGQARAYKGRAVEARRLGRELNVRYLVEAEMRTQGDKVGVMVRLIDAENGYPGLGPAVRSGLPADSRGKVLRSPGDWPDECATR